MQIITLKSALIFAFLFLSIFNVRSECPCNINMERMVFESDSTIRNYLSQLELCYSCKEDVGIFFNPCTHPYLAQFNNRDIMTLNSCELDLVLYLQKRCLNYYKKTDYPIDLCSSTRADSLMTLGSPAFELGRLLEIGCETMKSDLKDEIDIKRYEWSKNTEATKPKNFIYSSPPYKGKGFFIGGACLLGVTVFGAIVSVPIVQDYEGFVGSSSSEGGTWFRLGFGWMVPAITLVSVPCSGVLFAFGSKKRNEYSRYLEEKNRSSK